MIIAPRRPKLLLLTMPALLAAALTLQGCASQPVETRDNSALRQSIFDSVPESWRSAAASIEDIAPLAVSPELREFAHGAIRSNDAGRERMLSLVRAILSDDGVGLTYDPGATLTASEAFQTGVGNCLGFSNLLIAAARELGIAAKYELVLRRPRWDKVQNVLVATLHIRVVSLVSGRRMVFDFYPLPLESGFSTKPLSDTDALAHHLNNLAAESMHAGDGARAYGLLYNALEAAPQFGFIWSNLGLLLARHDMESAAEAAFQEALAVSPEGMSALSNLQRLYLHQEREAEARELGARLERYRLSNPYYHAWLGERAYEQGDLEQALQHYKDAIKRKKNEPAFYVQLSSIYEDLGLTSAAVRAKQKSEDIEKPRSTNYRVGRPQPDLGSHIPRQ